MIAFRIIYVTSIITAVYAENGFWQITFYGGEAHKIRTGHFCDEFGSCDPYMKVLINGVEVFQTEPKSAQKHPDFKETYYSPRISKDAKITIEMWDSDNKPGRICFGTHDELMSQWEGNVESFQRYTTLVGQLWDDEYQNNIDYTSSWIPDYLIYE